MMFGLETDPRNTPQAAFPFVGLTPATVIPNAHKEAHWRLGDRQCRVAGLIQEAIMHQDAKIALAIVIGFLILAAVVAALVVRAS